MITQQLLLQVILILLNAFFAASEIAIISLNTSKLRKASEEGDKVSARLLTLVEEPTGFLSTIQIGITLAGFLGSAFAADNFSGYLTDWIYQDLGFTIIPLSVLKTLSVIAITLILSYFTLVFGELVPKRIAMQKSMAMARLAYRIIAFLSTIMRPAVWFLTVSTNLVLKLLHFKTEAEEENVTEEEIKFMVELGEENGSINSNEKEWIQNVLEFNDTLVRNCMKHVSEVTAISLNASAEEITNLIQETGYSRFPVYNEDINDIMGLLNAKDFLLRNPNEEPFQLQTLLRPAYFIPETIHASMLFQDLQRKKQHMAIIVDEYGETCGIVTLEDLIEEIFGKIYDEFDENEPAEIELISENLWRISGTASIDDISEALEVEIPESPEYTTLGGMVFSCLRSIPKDGTTVDVEIHGLHIHVTTISKRKILSAHVSKLKS